jgi:hypothetical protein
MSEKCLSLAPVGREPDDCGGTFEVMADCELPKGHSGWHEAPKARARYEEADAPRPESEPGVWLQERPTWCPHLDCLFRRRAMDSICGGELPEPEPHLGDSNTHRVCLNGVIEGEIFDLQVNATDLGWFRWIFDALDGLETSWLSERATEGEQLANADE